MGIMDAGSTRPPTAHDGARRGPRPSSRARRLGSTAAWLTLLGALALPPTGAASGEDETKASFLLNFTRFVDWPESSFSDSRAPFVICVLNDSGFASTATSVIGSRTVDDRSVKVIVTNDIERTRACHILYVPASQGDQMRSVVRALSSDSVLTVSDDENFTTIGGIASFTHDGDKLGVEINKDAASGAGLKVSSRLLRIAERRGAGL